ncbi:unnamed protein product [Camellia sinensis]
MKVYLSKHIKIKSLHLISITSHVFTFAQVQMNPNHKAWSRITKEVEQINKSLTVIWVIVSVTVLKSILGKNIEEEIGIRQ